MLWMLCYTNQGNYSDHSQQTQTTQWTNQKSKLIHVTGVNTGKRLQASLAELSHAKPEQIGHFRVVFCLCFKTSPSAKPFIWKWVWFAFEWTCEWKWFSCERFRSWTRFEREVKGTRKWLIAFDIDCKPLYSTQVNSAVRAVWLAAQPLSRTKWFRTFPRASVCQFVSKKKK